MVEPHRSLETWKTGAEARIAAALGKTPTLITAGDIEDSLRRGGMRLWSIFDGDGATLASFVTEIVRGSGGAAVNVVAIGGADMSAWIGKITDELVAYAKRHGCKYIAEMGRPGWRKVLSEHGWVDGPAVMIKAVA